MILRLDGKEVEEMRELPGIVSATPIGREVDVEILRKGKPKTLEVTIGRLEDPQQIAASSKPQGLDELGFEVQNPTPALMQRFGLHKANGVIVTSVRPVSPADEAGLRPGDVILEAAFDSVETVAELKERLEAAETAVLLVARGDSTVFTTIRRS